MPDSELPERALFQVRTTNHIEGWHHGLNARIGKSHVNIFELIRHLKDEEHRLKLERLQLDMGHPVRPMRKKYREANERLMNLVDLGS